MSESEKAAETLREAEERTFEVNVSGVPSEDSSGDDKKSVPFAAKLPLIICAIGLAALPLIFSAMTVLYPFHLAANGIGEVIDFFVNIKNKIVHVFTDEYLTEGDIPEELADELGDSGITTGVIDSDGNFIATHKIIKASGPDYIVAAADGSELRVKAPATGSELMINFKGQNYTAKQFKTALETDDELYTAFDNAIGGDSLFFYDRSGENTFTDLGINRDPYHNFDSKAKEIADNPTDEQKEKMKSGLTSEQVAFEELFAEAIDYDPNKSSTSAGSADDSDEGSGDGDDGGFAEAFGEGDDSGSDGVSTEDSSQTEETLAKARTLAETYIRSVANKTKASTVEEANKKAAALLNAAISANEPYQSSRASAAVLIAAEQAKAGSGGPVNEMAIYMTADYAEIPDDDENPNAEKASASDSENLSAIVGDIDFDKEAAAEYSRDRVSVKKDVDDEGKQVTVSTTSGFKRLINWIIGLFRGSASAEPEVLVDAYKDDIAKALYMKASSLMKGKKLGERVTEGLSFLNVTLTKNAGGTNASGEEAVALYNEYTKKLYDRRVAAERATKSPFDLSSPNTFFGSVVNNVYAIGISDSSTFGKFAKLGSLASKSFGNLMLGAYAEDLTTTYLGTSGDCPTVGALKAEGDIYCNQKTTYDLTEFGSSGKNVITATLKDYAESNIFEELRKNFDGDLKDGKIKEGYDVADYIILNAGRGSTPGVKDANVCEAKKQGTKPGGLFSFLFGDGNAVAGSCSDDDPYATGEVFANSNTEKSKWKDIFHAIQGYYLEVYARELTGYYKQEGKTNPIVAFREEYYKKNPKDTSFEGTLAYRTGWSKEDVIAGIEAYNYLAYLENYDPTSRLAFFEEPEAVEIYFEETPTPTDVRLAEKNKIVFDEKRNRVVLI